MKNLIEEFNVRQDWAEERISKFKDIWHYSEEQKRKKNEEISSIYGMSIRRLTYVLCESQKKSDNQKLIPRNNDRKLSKCGKENGQLDPGNPKDLR